VASSINRRSFITAAGLAAVALPSSASLSAREVHQWDQTADVVIAGSGSAGTAAAIEASRLGNDVLVLEKLLKLGGSSAMSGGVVYLGGGTPIQKACGFDDTVEQMYKFIVAAGSKHPHLDKIQRYCERSVEHFHWLVQMGVPYKNSFTQTKGLPGTDDSLYYSGNELAYPCRDITKPIPRGHLPSELGWTGGRRLMQALLASAKKLGVKYQTQTSCERLIQESDGRICGVSVTVNGQQKMIRARKGVVLASGGFIHNRDMVKQHAPQMADCSVPWGNQADLGMGIQMGIAVGASTLRMDQGFTIIPLYQPEHVLKGIIVNKTAQRFIAEESYHAVVGYEIAYNQQGQAYLIADSRSHYGYDDYRVKVLAEGASLTELANKVGFPPGALQHSVSYFNQHAKEGRDPLFHKNQKYLQPLQQGPFYAYDLSVDKAFFPAHTFGGLHTSVDGEVINGFGEVIPGLYAAGRTTSGLPSAPYIASGLSVGDCTFFGRQAGRAVGGQS
jgi:succinate dehydrogenase/fumarate reductase flavoprotein subunit